MELPKYPIYSFSFRWSQDGIQNPEYPKWYEGLPENRTWNGTGFSKMYKEEKSDEELELIAQEWWTNYLEYDSKEKKSILNPGDLTKTITRKPDNTWNGTWFSHETFIIDGVTDEEYIKSFTDFVNKYEWMQNKDIDDLRKHDPNIDYHCLMGAENRWRWSSGGKNEDGTEYEKLPCRCTGCTKEGVVRIAH